MVLVGVSFLFVDQILALKILEFFNKKSRKNNLCNGSSLLEKVRKNMVQIRWTVSTQNKVKHYI